MNSNLDPSPRRLSAAEKEFEKAIRPADFHSFYGQAKVIENIIVFVQAARARGEALDHVLLHGPPGLGKTTLSHIIATELGDREIPPEQRPIVMRCIHTTADFDYADSLYFSPDAVEKAKSLLRKGTLIVTDTNMALAGINKPANAFQGHHILHAQIICCLTAIYTIWLPAGTCAAASVAAPSATHGT